MVAARDYREDDGGSCLMGTVWVLQDQRALEMDGGDGSTTV